MVAAVVAAVLVGEGALRLRFPFGLQGKLETSDLYPWLVFDPLLSWRNSPGFRQEGLGIGDHGERLDGGGVEPAAGAPRVLFLGDSRTFGIWRDEQGLRFDNDFPARLARRAGARLEVLNAGTVGYTSSQGLRQWMLLDEAIEPDVVVAAFGTNDNFPAWNPSYRVSEPHSAIVRRLLYRFGNWRWVQGGFWAARRSPWSPSQIDWKPWVSLEEYRRNVERFAAESRLRDVQLLFLHVPLRPLARGENEALAEGDTPLFEIYGVQGLEELHEVHDRLRDVTRDVARSYGVAWLDVSDGLEAFRELHPRLELYSAYDLIHPNDRGAEEIARLVEERLVSSGWMAPPGSGEGDR